MRGTLLSALAIGLLAAAAGCARNPFVGSGIVGQRQCFGDVGIRGYDNNLTLLSGSKVRKLSIWGDNNRVTVEDGVTLSQIEFFGYGNTVSVSDTLVVRTSEVGTNQLIRRPRELRGPKDLSEWDAAAPTYPPPPAQPPTEPAPELKVEVTPPPSAAESQTIELPEGEIEFRPPPTMEVEPLPTRSGDDDQGSVGPPRPTCPPVA